MKLCFIHAETLWHPPSNPAIIQANKPELAYNLIELFTVGKVPRYPCLWHLLSQVQLNQGQNGDFQTLTT